jgi:hypothetical protein
VICWITWQPCSRPSGDIVAVHESGSGPQLTTCALQQVVGFLGYTGHQIYVVVTAARDPKLPFASKQGCSWSLIRTELAVAGSS